MPSTSLPSFPPDVLKGASGKLAEPRRAPVDELAKAPSTTSATGFQEPSQTPERPSGETPPRPRYTLGALAERPSRPLRGGVVEKLPGRYGTFRSGFGERGGGHRRGPVGHVAAAIWRFVEGAVGGLSRRGRGWSRARWGCCRGRGRGREDGRSRGPVTATTEGRAGAFGRPVLDASAARFGRVAGAVEKGCCGRLRAARAGCAREPFRARGARRRGRVVGAVEVVSPGPFEERADALERPLLARSGPSFPGCRRRHLGACRARGAGAGGVCWGQLRGHVAGAVEGAIEGRRGAFERPVPPAPGGSFRACCERHLTTAGCGAPPRAYRGHR
jgi:hypothetical protein